MRVGLAWARVTRLCLLSLKHEQTEKALHKACCQA